MNAPDNYHKYLIAISPAHVAALHKFLDLCDVWRIERSELVYGAYGYIDIMVDWHSITQSVTDEMNHHLPDKYGMKGWAAIEFSDRKRICEYIVEHSTFMSEYYFDLWDTEDFDEFWDLFFPFMINLDKEES